jgi:hypothetical protein
MTDPLTIRIPRGSHPLIDLLLREIARELHGAVEECRDMVARRDLGEFEVCLGGTRRAPAALSIARERPHEASITVGQASGVVPIALAASGPFVVDAQRVLLACVPAGERRTKMAARVAGELRRRGVGARLVVADDAPDNAIRAIAPDEVYPDLDGPELANLLAGIGCCIDAAGEDDSPAMTAIAAAAAGVPLLVAPGSCLANLPWPSVSVVAGYYPDAFCDAIKDCGERREPAGRDAMANAAAAFLEVVKRGVEP